MLLTLEQCQSSSERLIQIASSCATGSDFISLVNTACRKLMKRGSFFGTVQPIACAAYGNTVTWPAYVGTILALNVCGRPVELFNHWYRFMPYDEQKHRNWANRWMDGGKRQCGDLRAEFGATSPVFNQMNPLRAMPLRFFIDNASDAGQTITIFGKDQNGQIINTLRPDGTWQDGLLVTLAYPSVDTAVQFQVVNRVLKSQTNGVVRGYQIDLANSVLRDLCYYRPFETSPDYVVSTLQGPIMCPAQPYKVEALVKLQFVPVANPQDLVIIEDIDALTIMVQAQKAREAGDIEDAKAMEVDAVSELNYQLRDKYPLEAFNVSYRPFGNARLEKQRIGTMI